MTKEHSQIFWKEIVLPNVNDASILLLDSWGGQKPDIFELPDDKRIFVKQIPPGCTGLIQPCDTYFFR